MAQTYELTKEMYEACYRDERSKNKPSDEYKDILTRPDFQELTINLFENHDEYCLTEDEVYDINDKYFRWDGHKMVEIPKAEVTETMIDDRLEFTSADYKKIFEQKYEDETDEMMPDFKKIEQLPHFKDWVHKTLKFMKYEPANGDIIDVACIGYRNQGFYQWYDKTKRIINLYGGDYGVCHPIFRVGDQPGEFSPDHWMHQFGYNECAIFLSKKLVEQINEKEPKPSKDYSCHIDIDGRNFYINSQGPITEDNIRSCEISYCGKCNVIRSEDLEIAGKFKMFDNMNLVLNKERIDLINAKLQPKNYTCKIEFGGLTYDVSVKDPKLNADITDDCYFIYDEVSKKLHNC
jgi:hypothetical protein